MPDKWENREFRNTNDRFKDQENEFGIENLVNNPVRTSAPDSGKMPNMVPCFAKVDGTLYLYIKEGGVRKRLAFSEG